MKIFINLFIVLHGTMHDKSTHANIEPAAEKCPEICRIKVIFISNISIA